MRIALVLTPLSESNLKLARQVGADEVVGRAPGTDFLSLVQLKTRIEDAGMRLSVLEGGLPLDHAKYGGPGSDAEIADFQSLVRNMGAAGIPILCYNFMVGGDWSRTSLAIPERGGALVSGFDAERFERAPLTELGRIPETQVWDALERFLAAVVPVAQEAGVTLAMHPDDPPLPSLRGLARIMWNVEAFERLVRIVPSPANGICFCQGTFKEMGIDLADAVRRLAPHIRYVHFRDVRGTVPRFQETFHDNGPTDMAAMLRLYREIGFDGPIRPDHVPQLEGESDGEPGYTMLGRLFAVGYMRGLLHGMGHG